MNIITLQNLNVTQFARCDYLISLMSFAQRIVFIAGKKYGFIFRENGKTRIDNHRLKSFARANRKGIIHIHLSMEGTEKYMKRHWPGASNSKHSIERRRSELQNTGLIAVEGSGFKPHYRKRTPPAKIYAINFIALFRLIFAIQEVLIFKGVEFPTLELMDLLNEKKSVEAAGYQGEWTAESLVSIERKIEKVVLKAKTGDRGTIPMHGGASIFIAFKKIKSAFESASMDMEFYLGGFRSDGFIEAVNY
jgi:hypothetical protein